MAYGCGSAIAFVVARRPNGSRPGRSTGSRRPQECREIAETGVAARQDPVLHPRGNAIEGGRSSDYKAEARRRRRGDW